MKKRALSHNCERGTLRKKGCCRTDLLIQRVARPEENAAVCMRDAVCSSPFLRRQSFKERDRRESMAKAKAKTVFFCKECGYESAKWMGQCPGCRQWNTLVEERTAAPSRGKKAGTARAQKLTG